MKPETTPLADRIRPQSLKEFVGQEHLVGPGKPLRVAIENDRIFSLIFWGPPGCGKTTLARIIANETESHFVGLSAVAAGKTDVTKVAKEARERLQLYRKKTILFLDEIHRFNKTQQDALLPFVEDGTIVFIGATTENPSFEVIGPLLSRCRVYTLDRLTPDEVKTIVERALVDKERGLGNYNVKIDDALEFLVQAANGDARVALNALEIAVQQAFAAAPEHAGAKRRVDAGRGEPDQTLGVKITLEAVSEIMEKNPLLYDRAGEEHYNTISAFIKSMRGSDPDAALYYLARMLEAGEDPLFIARRMVIFASEDIGNADPQALPLAVSVFEACERIGLPECQINLAHGATYLASAPKSNASYSALLKAQKDVKETLNEPIPLHICNAPTQLMKDLGYGKGYKYPHNFEGHYVKEEYFPKKLRGRRYYFPTKQGFEKKVRERLAKLRDLITASKSWDNKCPKEL